MGAPGKNWASGYGRQASSHYKTDRPSLGLRPPSGVTDPRCMPKNLAFSGKFAIETLLARYVLPAEVGTVGVGTFTLNGLVYSPSDRLKCVISVVIEPDNQSAPDASYFAGSEPTLAMRAMERNPVTGRETALQLIFPTTGTEVIPNSYELSSACELIRVTVVLKDTSFSASFVPNTERANVKMIAKWEPNVEMNNAERDSLYARCSVSYGSPQTIQNNAA